MISLAGEIMNLNVTQVLQNLHDELTELHQRLLTAFGFESTLLENRIERVIEEIDAIVKRA
jgi:hypothetical protein